MPDGYLHMAALYSVTRVCTLFVVMLSRKNLHLHVVAFAGLDDARNTAKLAWRMMCDGCVIQITKSLAGVRW